MAREGLVGVVIVIKFMSCGGLRIKSHVSWLLRVCGLINVGKLEN